MVVVIAKMEVAEGKAEAFKALVGELAGQVLANEPGCKMYQLCVGQEPQVFTIVERYVDMEALGAHGKTEHFKAAASKFGEVLAGRPEIQVLTEVQ